MRKPAQSQESAGARLPKNWMWSTLGEVSEKPQYGWTTKANHEVGELKLLRTTDITSGTVDWSTVPYCTEEPEDAERYLVKSGDILVSRAGSVGVSFLINNAERAVFASYLIRFRPKEGVEAKYFYYYLKSPNYWAAIGASKSGIAVPNVNASKLSLVPIPIAPSNEQRCIVAEIEKQFSRLDEAVASIKRIKTNLKRYKAAVLKAAVEGKLTEDWREQHPDVEPARKLLERILAKRRAEWNGRGKYKEPTPPDTNDLPSLPKGWTWATVEQLAAGFAGAIQSGPFGSQLLHSEFVDDGILAIGIDNVLDGKFSLGHQHRITPRKFEILKKFEARPRDVVITVMATVGRVCVLPQSLEQAIITKHCYRITPARGNVDSDFLAVALRADSSTRQYIFGNVRGQTRPGINGQILKAAPVSLPPFAEQKEIVSEAERRLSVIEELEASVEANSKRVNRLRQSVLSRAFKGKLVPQSSSDEPASVLLNRLRGASAFKDSLQPKDTRKPGGTTMPKPKAEHSGEVGRIITKSLYQILRDSEKRLTPEQLFANAGFGPELIDQFYEELKRETQAGRILQERPNKTAVYLKAISNANR
jgi:type I restriction enzyme, S subunit